MNLNQENFLDMDIIIKERDLIKKGVMHKDFFQMSEEEKKNWKEQIAAKTKATIFSIGQALVYEKDGQMIAEYADGKLMTL